MAADSGERIRDEDFDFNEQVFDVAEHLVKELPGTRLDPVDSDSARFSLSVDCEHLTAAKIDAGLMNNGKIDVVAYYTGFEMNTVDLGSCWVPASSPSYVIQAATSFYYVIKGDDDRISLCVHDTHTWLRSLGFCFLPDPDWESRSGTATIEGVDFTAILKPDSLVLKHLENDGLMKSVGEWPWYPYPRRNRVLAQLAMRQYIDARRNTDAESN